MNARELYRKGLEHLDKGEIDPAHELFSKALELEPDHPEIIGDMAVVYFHQRRYELAIIFLNRAQELDPHNGYRYSSRAYVKDKLGDVEGAIADYKKAVEIDPEDAISYNNLGMAEERLGYIERAKANFKRADALREAEEKQDGDFVMIPSEKKGDRNMNAEAPKQSKGRIMASVFSSRKAFADFMKFIFNGFRIKE